MSDKVTVLSFAEYKKYRNINTGLLDIEVVSVNRTVNNLVEFINTITDEMVDLVCSRINDSLQDYACNCFKNPLDNAPNISISKHISEMKYFIDVDKYKDSGDSVNIFIDSIVIALDAVFDEKISVEYKYSVNAVCSKSNIRRINSRVIITYTDLRIISGAMDKLLVGYVKDIFDSSSVLFKDFPPDSDVTNIPSRLVYAVLAYKVFMKYSNAGWQFVNKDKFIL